MKKLTLITAIILTANLLFAQIINIPADYPTIQQGINHADNGDTVLVQPGTYFENVEISNKSLTLASLYLTTHDTSYISQTIIDGGQEGNVIYAVVGVQGAIDISVAGFTIQNGTANFEMGWLESGGGICIIWGLWSNPTEPNNIKLSNLIIRDNYAADKGGGVYIGFDNFGGGVVDSTSNVSIKDVLIQKNRVGFGLGGGICCENFICSLQNVTIENNRVQWKGGGGYFLNSNSTLQNVVITSDTADPVGAVDGHGGGLHFEYSNPVLQNVVVSENWPNGIECNNSNIILNNATISQNLYEGLLCDSSTAIIANSIFWENNDHPWITWQIFSNGSPVSISYSDIEDGENGIYCNNLNWLEGNINEDPLFLGSGDHSYQLSAGSPCIDAGNPDTTGLNLPYDDIIGNKRIWDGDNNGSAIIDMGAYEFGALPVGIEKLQVPSSKFQVRSYPNPVSENCTIEFELAKPARVSIQIYNNMGDLLIEPKNQIYSSGLHQVNLNLIDLNAGIYFCRIQVGNETLTKKIIKVN